ncbi:hypothetical protein [Acetomicrobium sp. S15 = DSM 107314]|uniref:hypothetical protein n=1 Tax=Acetomicrobium sp. S15 = DSM 107314 TaxID=2529858 RepID=UPI0018E1AD53|nr:hypothetical protein [Acetomicrobium sp. S15 = DSM 107314]
MKRSTIAVLALVALVAAAGSALAYGGYGFEPHHMWGGGYGPRGMMGGWRSGYGGCGYGLGAMNWGYGPQGGDFDSRSRLNNAPYGTEIPPKIAENMRQLERTRLELQSMVYEGRIDRAKASQLHERMLSLQNEIARWRFEQRLNFSENRQ